MRLGGRGDRWTRYRHPRCARACQRPGGRPDRGNTTPRVARLAGRPHDVRCGRGSL